VGLSFAPQPVVALSVRGTDALALSMVAAGIASGSPVTQLEDRVLVVILAVAWVGSAARRLAGYRSGTARPLVIDRSSPLSAWLLIAIGTAPWFALEGLRAAAPTAAIWTRFDFPPLLTAVGIFAAMATLGLPLIRGGYPGNAAVGSDSTDIHASALLCVAVFLLTRSPVVGLFAGFWLISEAVSSAGRSRVEAPAASLDAPA